MILFSFNYPPNDGGISRLCGEIVQGLLRRGIEVLVLTQASKNNNGSFVPKASEARITSRRPWRELSALQELRRKAISAPVICGIWYPEGLLATLANIHPLVLLVYGSEVLPTRSRSRRTLWRHLMQTVFNKSDLVIACSEYSLRLLKEKVPDCEAIAIPLAVDHVRFAPGNQTVAKNKFGVNGKHVLCSVSRIRAYKGHDVVFQALANLPAHLRNQFIYLIVGIGRDQLVLQSRANEKGVGSLVRWLNYIPEDDLPDIYRAADLFVLCTREVINQQEVEGFGLVFLEAQACGTPVVGTRTGGIPDAIKEGEGGWLIDQDDTQALTRILLKLAEAPDEFKDAGIKGRDRIERECTWERYLDQFISALEARGIQVG